MIDDADETQDALLRGRLQILQPRTGARVSLDALLLADFAAAPRGPGEPAPRLARVLDLGCGTGVIGLALALAAPAAKVVGVELHPGMAALARRNAALNQVAERVSVVEGTLARPRELPLEAESFELAVCNPPYREAGRGRPAKGQARAVARQELSWTLAEVTAAARHFLAARGRLALVFPADRLAEVFAAFATARLAPRTLRPVYTIAGEPARRVLVEAVRDYRGGVLLRPALVIHKDDRRSYTPETARILGD